MIFVEFINLFFVKTRFKFETIAKFGGRNQGGKIENNRMLFSIRIFFLIPYMPFFRTGDRSIEHFDGGRKIVFIQY